MITGIRVKSFAARNRHIAWPFDYGLTSPFTSFHLAHTHRRTILHFDGVCVFFLAISILFSAR